MGTFLGEGDEDCEELHWQRGGRDGIEATVLHHLGFLCSISVKMK